MFRGRAQYEPLQDPNPYSSYSSDTLLSPDPAYGYQFQAPTQGQAFRMNNYARSLASSSYAYSSVSSFDAGGYQSGLEAPLLPPLRKFISASWRHGARLSALIAAISFAANLGAGIWAARQYGMHSLIVEVFRGDCVTVERINTWVHLAINVLSTALLSGSNYCMQCLSAPNRNEVDVAHSKKKWLDIGVPSVRNLRNIATRKVALWWLLGLSSIPLHLMYNSAFFSSIATNDYNVVYATDSFVSGAAFTIINDNNAGWTKHESFHLAAIQDKVSSYERLENAQCIQAYANDLITNRRNVVIIADNSSAIGGGSLLGSDSNAFSEGAIGGANYDPYQWICSEIISDYEFCYQELSQIIANASNWKPQDFNAQYCLSEKILGTCSFNINLGIIFVVVACNLGKLAGMLYVSFGALPDPLITVGDAVSSFLENPDPSTKGLCIVTKHDIIAATKSPMWVYFQGPKMWNPVRKRWFGAASKTRWWTCLLLFIAALATIGVLLAWAIVTLQSGRTIKDLWKLGFGQVHFETLITGWGISNMKSPQAEVTASVLIANLPQMLLSFLYIKLNGLITSMFLADEWSHFAHERKPLRVSSPKGQQRNTYFLQLPYRISIPLMAMSGLLHWLVSQSIFLAVVAEYGVSGQLVNQVAVATCGFSPFAMICVIVVGGFLIVFALALGFRRFRPGMPLVGSCSAAISAACHSPEPGGATKALRWGAVSKDVSDFTVGHCCFSSGKVEEPIFGHAYAGSHS